MAEDEDTGIELIPKETKDKLIHIGSAIVSYLSECTKAFSLKNSSFLLWGLFPILAITISLDNALSMMVAFTGIFVLSAFFMSLLKYSLEQKRFIVTVITTILTTAVYILFQENFSGMQESLGIFFPLIAVNGMLYARAETFSSKHNPLRAILDALGFSVALSLLVILIALLRELFSTGRLMVFGIQVVKAKYLGAFPLLGLAPGALIVLALIIAMHAFIHDQRKKLQKIKKLEKKEERKEEKKDE
ncbi:hypothetical protein GOV09_05605 [Candidatus Woesearchaeota archaeon]|nr:hypothetical protein [Candidatus Woesearchaeota archaeon]